jgi:mannan endo-1,4-beta-mannosidase
MNLKIVATGAAVVIAAAVGAWTVVGGGADKNATSSNSTASPIYNCAAPARDSRYVGLSVPNFPPDANELTALEEKVQLAPSAVSIYISLGAKLDMSAVTKVCSQGALPIIEIDSDESSIHNVIDGSDDAILISYAKQIASLHFPVAMDFDHEFNGPWFHWGFKYETAQEFVAAWRHLVTIFRSNGATDVKWVWNPNVSYSDTAALRPWYPGDSYVTWVGLDGYFTGPHSTFKTVFGPTLDQVRQFTSRPVFIVETGASPSSQRPRAIDSLFDGMASTPGMVGVIWFDYDKAVGHDWYIDNDPASLAAFSAAAKTYMKGS